MSRPRSPNAIRHTDGLNRSDGTGTKPQFRRGKTRTSADRCFVPIQAHELLRCQLKYFKQCRQCRTSDDLQIRLAK